MTDVLVTAGSKPIPVIMAISLTVKDELTRVKIQNQYSSFGTGSEHLFFPEELCLHLECNQIDQFQKYVAKEFSW